MPCLVQGDADAPPVLLLHAWAESRGSFYRLLPGLASFRVDKPQDGYSLAEQAQDAAAVLDALQVPSASVVSSSSGGYVAQQLAVEHPDRVAALVLVGTPLTLQGRPGFADDVDGLTNPVAEDWVRSFLASFPLIQEVPPWYMEDRVHDGVKMPSHAWKLSLGGLYTATPPTETETIEVPTLILWGGQDGLLPRADQDTLAARIEGAELKIYPDVGFVGMPGTGGGGYDGVPALCRLSPSRSKTRQASAGPRRAVPRLSARCPPRNPEPTITALPARARAAPNP